MAKGINHTSDAEEDELIKLIELDTADRFDISTSFPLAQAQNVEGDVDQNSSVNIDIGDIKEDIVNISSALTLIGTTDKSALDYLEEEGDEADDLHLMTYQNSSEVDAEVNVDAVSLLMPDLSNATALDCGNFVDYDEFNMCLNNILSEKDDQELMDCDASGSANMNSGRHHQQQQQQQWCDVNEVLNIVPLRFQEFATEASITGDDRSASSSSSQMA